MIFIISILPIFRDNSREMRRRTNFNYGVYAIGIREISEFSSDSRSYNTFCNPFNSASARYILVGMGQPSSEI